MSNSFFRVEMLPAIQGDSIWVEYGNELSTYRILIDGGPIKAYPAVETKLNEMDASDKQVELVVITHVDTDHIEGIIRLFAEERNQWILQPIDIWFNGWKHIKKSNILGGREGDFLSALIRKRAFNEWNKAFNGEAVVVEDNKPLPLKTLEGGMKITLLSPNLTKLEAMVEKWEGDVEKFGFDPGDLENAWKQLVSATKYHVAKGVLGGESNFEQMLQKQLKTDQSIANGTSIAFLAEFDGKSCLFLGDAHHDLICQSIRKLIYPNNERLRVDAVKVSHHGSRNNISKDLMNLIDSKNFLFSTNGFKHEHPNKLAVQAVINWSMTKPTLWFNYASEYTLPWKKQGDAKKPYNVRYPLGKNGGIKIEL